MNKKYKFLLADMDIYIVISIIFDKFHLTFIKVYKTEILWITQHLDDNS